MLIKINKKQAIKTILVLLTLVTLFHLAIITQLIPYTIVWAGKLNTTKDMYVFESISLTVNLLLTAVIIMKAYVVKNTIYIKIIDIILWLFIVLFALNTLGNLMAKTMFEKLVFTPLTFILALLIWLIVRKDKM